MVTNEERQTAKLEWACRQIEYLLNKVDYLTTHVHRLEDVVTAQILPITVRNPLIIEETMKAMARAVARGEGKPWQIWEVPDKPRCEHRDTWSIKDRGDGVVVRCLACGAGRKGGIWQRGDEV